MEQETTDKDVQAKRLEHLKVSLPSAEDGEFLYECNEEYEIPDELERYAVFCYYSDDLVRVLHVETLAEAVSEIEDSSDDHTHSLLDLDTGREWFPERRVVRLRGWLEEGTVEYIDVQPVFVADDADKAEESDDDDE